jgi:tRNA uridine 5-carboxymethylaminomethyl modification enzyme
MLTARSEFRLALRADNAGLRLTDQGIAWGCIGPERAAAHGAFRQAVRDALDRARQDGATPATYASAGIPVNQDGRWRSVLEVLALPAMSRDAADRAFPWLQTLPAGVRAELEAQALYAPYLERQAAELRALEREERMPIPTAMDFTQVPGLSAEMRQRLSRARPTTLGGAGRISGITPAALAALAVHLRRTAEPCST